MNIKKTDKGYEVESSSTKGKVYLVDPDRPWCDCPAYRFRYMAQGKLCKHIQAVKDLLKESPAAKKKEIDKKVILKLIEEEGEVDAIEMIDQYGEKTVNELIEEGEIVEEKGVLKILG